METSKLQKVDLRALYNRSYAGQYLTSVEIDRPTNVKISSLETETVSSWQKGKKPQERLIMRFEGHDRGLVVNKTNYKNLADVFGWDQDDWIGKEVVLESVEVEAFGRVVDSIVVRPAGPANRKEPGVQSAKKSKEGEIEVESQREEGDPPL